MLKGVHFFHKINTLQICLNTKISSTIDFFSPLYKILQFTNILENSKMYTVTVGNEVVNQQLGRGLMKHKTGGRRKILLISFSTLNEM